MESLTDIEFAKLVISKLLQKCQGILNSVQGVLGYGRICICIILDFLNYAGQHIHFHNLYIFENSCHS